MNLKGKKLSWMTCETVTMTFWISTFCCNNSVDHSNIMVDCCIPIVNLSCLKVKTAHNRVRVQPALLKLL